jgi:hypothetical protein
MPTRHKILICSLFVSLLYLSVTQVHARVFELSPKGDMTLQQAADLAQAGDTIRLTPGVYQQRVAFNKNSGEYGKPITLEGPADAIIDGSLPADIKWEDVSFITKGLYRTPLAWRPWTITANNKSITQFYYKRVKIGTTGNKNTQWPALFEKGTQGRTLKGAQAVAMVNDDERMLYIRFEDNTNPATLSFALSPKFPVVLVDGVHRIVIRGVTIRNGWCGVYLKDTLGSFVEHCHIGPTHHGVQIAENADRCTVRFNDITLNPLAHIDPKGDGRGNWTNWLCTKTHGYWDHFGISFADSTGGNQVHDNYVHDHWGGIEDHSRSADANEGNVVHHNFIQNIADDGLEPEGTQPNCQWYDNIVTNCICGFRIKPVKKGPMYIYRNIIYNCGEGLRNFSTSSSKPEVFVYQNTTYAWRAAYSSNSVFDDGLKNYHYYNNLLIGANAWSNAKGSKLPDWHGDYNILLRRSDSSDWDKSVAILKKQGLEAHSQFLATDTPVVKDLEKFDFTLIANSPAKGAGANISQRIGKTLPGMEDAKYQGSSPDIGALAYGQAMPKLPRTPDQIADLPQSGYWPAADARFRRTIDVGQVGTTTGSPLVVADEISRYWDGNVSAKPLSEVALEQKEAAEIPDDVKLGENLLQNPQFAQHSGDDISDWKLTNSGGTKHTLHVDTEHTPKGVAQSARIDMHGTGSGMGQFFQRIYVKPGHKYRFSGYLMSPVAGAGIFQIKLYKGKQELTRITSVSSGAMWKKAIVDITETDVDKIEVIGRFKQTSQTSGKSIWFADMSLAQVLGSSDDGASAKSAASPVSAVTAVVQASKQEAQPAVEVKTSTDTATPQEGNLLENPLFADVNDKAEPAKWKLVNGSNTSHTAVVVTDDKPDGVGQALKLTINGESKYPGQMYQRLYTKPDGKLKFSCYLKGDIAGIAFVQIKIFNGKKEIKRIDTGSNATEWKKVSVIIDNPDINKIEVIARFKQSGYVQGKHIYFADMYLGNAVE